MRKGLLRQAVTGRYHRHGTIADADCVVGFSFGYREAAGEVLPGQSNSLIARFIADHYLSLPLILQWELASALGSSLSKTWTIDRHAAQGVYLDTREVARQAWEIMRAQGYATALVVAHPHHVARADAVCETLGMRTVVSDGLATVGFDAQSAQRWTRSQSVRETMAIAYYEVVGWL
jgi:uncharacterized SAM-binding protein YcdF (DUF218 family)